MARSSRLFDISVWVRTLDHSPPQYCQLLRDVAARHSDVYLDNIACEGLRQYFRAQHLDIGDTDGARGQRVDNGLAEKCRRICRASPSWYSSNSPRLIIRLNSVRLDKEVFPPLRFIAAHRPGSCGRQLPNNADFRD